MNLGNEYFPIYKEVLEIESFESFTSQIVVQNSKTFFILSRFEKKKFKIFVPIRAFFVLTKKMSQILFFILIENLESRKCSCLVGDYTIQ